MQEETIQDEVIYSEKKLKDFQDLELYYWFLKDIYPAKDLVDDANVVKLIKKEFNLDVNELEIYNLKKVLEKREIEDAEIMYSNVGIEMNEDFTN